MNNTRRKEIASVLGLHHHLPHALQVPQGMTMRTREEEDFERHAGYPPDDAPPEPEP
jgi:hypothetical protein